MPGRPKKPVLLHELHGTARPNRMAKRAEEMQLEPEIPEPPDWLLPEALAEWQRLIGNSKYRAVLATVDRAMLAAYCQLWAQFVASETEGKEFSGGRLTAMLQVASKLGLNPQDRTKIKAPAPPEKADNPWAALAG